MAKLIGHCFDSERGYTVFEIDGLKETVKLYAKVSGQTTETPETNEHRSVIPKAELGKLRIRHGKQFFMYSTQEDMPRFRELIISSLTHWTHRAWEDYRTAAALLKIAEQDKPQDGGQMTVLERADFCTHMPDYLCNRERSKDPAVCPKCIASRVTRYGISITETRAMPDGYTIAVDFDGTLCENRFPEIGEPKPLIIEYIKQQAAAGARIILHTCRENGTRRALLDEAVTWCEARGITLYAVNENPGNHYPKRFGVDFAGRKVYADLYIDDKCENVASIEAGLIAALREEVRKLHRWSELL